MELVELKKRLDSIIDKAYQGGVTLLPFLDEAKVLDLEKKDRNLTKEEEIYDKWGKSFKFEKNTIKDADIKFSPYEIYQHKEYSMLSNYEKKTIDCSFPTLKTLSYDYSLENIKTFFGKNNVFIFSRE